MKKGVCIDDGVMEFLFCFLFLCFTPLEPDESKENNSLRPSQRT